MKLLEMKNIDSTDNIKNHSNDASVNGEDDNISLTSNPFRPQLDNNHQPVLKVEEHHVIELNKLKLKVQLYEQQHNENLVKIQQYQQQLEEEMKIKNSLIKLARSKSNSSNISDSDKNEKTDGKIIPIENDGDEAFTKHELLTESQMIVEKNTFESMLNNISSLELQLQELTNLLTVESNKQQDSQLKIQSLQESLQAAENNVSFLQSISAQRKSSRRNSKVSIVTPIQQFADHELHDHLMTSAMVKIENALNQNDLQPSSRMSEFRKTNSSKELVLLSNSREEQHDVLSEQSESVKESIKSNYDNNRKKKECTLDDFATYIQKVFRAFHARNRVTRIKMQIAAASQGVLIAYKGTKQGNVISYLYYLLFVICYLF
jgi:hypothetical protein